MRAIGLGSGSSCKYYESPVALLCRLVWRLGRVTTAILRASRANVARMHVPSERFCLIQDFLSSTLVVLDPSHSFSWYYFESHPFAAILSAHCSYLASHLPCGVTGVDYSQSAMLFTSTLAVGASLLSLTEAIQLQRRTDVSTSCRFPTIQLTPDSGWSCKSTALGHNPQTLRPQRTPTRPPPKTTRQDTQC